MVKTSELQEQLNKRAIIPLQIMYHRKFLEDVILRTIIFSITVLFYPLLLCNIINF